MTRPNADESKSDAAAVEARIGQLREEIAVFSKELAVCEIAQAEYRAKEDPVARISFAAEIFQCQQDKLRLRVEIELLEKKIRRLQLGYAEDASPHTGQDPLF